MGGKTVSLRSTVLSLLLCQCGFFVFAKSASLPLFHRVDLILADSGPGAGGLSSFGKEVHLLDTLLRQLKSLPGVGDPEIGIDPLTHDRMHQVRLHLHDRSAREPDCGILVLRA